LKKDITPAERDELYRLVFNGPDGEAVLDDLLAACAVNAQTYTKGDTHHTAYREGQRSIGLRLLSILGKPVSEVE
jgi:hypothetical protein